MLKHRILALLIVLTLPVAAFAAKPILNLHDVAVPVKMDGSQHTLEEVQAAIIEGCDARRWSPVLAGDGLIRASITVRGKHFAEVEIPFSQTSYSIVYVRSENLDYNEKKQKIHRNYNNWVIKLSGTIDAMLRDGG